MTGDRRWTEDVEYARRGEHRWLIGRRDALSQVSRLVTAGHRLITVLGPPGGGRSAVVTAWASACAPLAVNHLVVVDEHSGPTAAERIDDLLATPDCTVLTSAPTAWGRSGERTVRLGPLPTAPAAARSADELLSRAAVRLYLLHATSLPGARDLDVATLLEINALCRLLDGLPLAIIVAAERAELLPPAAFTSLWRKVGDPVRALLGGRRPRGGHSFADAVDAGFQALPADERQIVDEMSGLEPDADLAAIAAICTADADAAGPAGLELDRTVELVASLVAHGLIQPTDPDRPDLRVSLWSTVARHAAAERTDGEDAVLSRGRHAGYFAALAQRLGRAVNTAGQAAALDGFAADYGNFVGAIGWSCVHERGRAAAIRILSAMWQYWYFTGDLSAGLDQLAMVLDAVGAGQATTDHDYGDLLLTAGLLLQADGDIAAASDQFVRLLRRGTTPSLRRHRAIALTQLALIARTVGGQGTRALLAESIAELRTTGNEPGLAFALVIGSEVKPRTPDGRAAGRRELKESIEIFARHQNQWGVSLARRALASLSDVRPGDVSADPPSLAEAGPNLTAVLDEAVALVRTPVEPRASRPNGSGLTARELDVLRLLALARTNSEIAVSLDIGIETVRRHVSNILTKLLLRNRVEAALWAVRHDL